MSNTIKGINVVKFRCKAGGGIFSFESEADIQSMRNANHYEEVLDEVFTPKVKEPEAAKEEVINVVISQKDFKKKLGRPAKNK